MELIYIDRLFAINLLTDYLILLVTARICGIYLRRVRYLISAVLGALYSCLSVIDGFEFLYLAPIKLCFGILMALISYSKEEKLLRLTLVFFAVSALFGGAVWAVSLKNGGSLGTQAYLSVSLPVLILSFGISYAVISLVFRRSLKNAEKSIFDVLVTHGGKSLRLRALSDSGNGLFDPFTGSAVLIVPAEKLTGIFGERAMLLGQNAQDAVMDKSFAAKLRLIPYSAVGTKSGMLLSFRPDSISINGAVRDDIIIAVSPTEVIGDGFDCIL